jgi:phosphoglycerate dehydrogenase-like enzyme
VHHYPCGVATNLDVDVITKKPVAIEEYENDQNTEGFKKVERVLPNIVFVNLKFPVDERSDGIIDRIPKA